MISIVLPDWQYFCLDLDSVAPKLDLYVGDKKINVSKPAHWNAILPQNLQLNRLAINSEKVGLINLFREPYRAGTCGQNGTLMAWPLMLDAMQPMGINQVKQAAICRQDQSHLVFVPSRMSYDKARKNCQRMEASGRFPVYSNLEEGSSPNF